ncbi:MAG: diguanylate cyclase [Clostridium sp.]
MNNNNILRLYLVECTLFILGMIIIYIILSQKLYKKKLSFIEDLQKKVEIDPLTGLYNKPTTKNAIIDFLSSEGNGNHALFVIDIDDFKVVNDMYGHLVGDDLLKKVSSSIRDIFRDEDIVGRFGGDEFTVFMKNVPSREALINKANRLCNVLSQNFVGSYGSISGSIGIATYPCNGNDYYTLFECADKAMYSAKRHGKNCFCIYEENIDFEDGIQNCGLRKNMDYTSCVNDIATYMFKTLYQTSNIVEALNSILKFVGNHFKLDRVYIYECINEEKGFLEEYQWCSNNTEKSKRFKIELTDEIIRRYKEAFDSKGIICCSDINELPNDVRLGCEDDSVTSFIHSSILDGSELKGIVGFDCCNDKGRVWTSDEIEALTLISEVISIFIAKKRIDNALKREREITRLLIDSLDLCTYVIDRNTYKILFISNKLSELTGAKVGDSCYSIIGSELCPCSDCKLFSSDLDGDKRSFEMTDKVFQGKVQVTVCNLIWIDGSNACIVDIKKKEKAVE